MAAKVSTKSAAFQPEVALGLARTAATCEAAAEALSSVGFTLSEAVDAVVRGMSGRSVGSVGEIVPEILSARGLSAVTDALKEVESTFARICALESVPRSEQGMVKALERTGVKLPDTQVKTLDRYSTSPGVREFSTIRALRGLRQWVHAGGLLEGLEYAFAHAEFGSSVEAALESVVRRGMDAEALVWAVIGVETNQHINLVWHQANKLARVYPDRAAADLFGWGWQGLRMALRNFDPERGFLFSTYACTRIAGTMRDGVRSESPIPKRLTTYVRKVVKAEEDLTQELGRAPILEEVARHLGEDLEQLKILPRLSPAASIEEITEISKERGSAPAWLVAHEDPADAAVLSAMSEDIERALLGLPENERVAVRLLVMDGLDPREACAVTGANARQMRQRRDKGLALLKSELESWRLVSAGE